MTPPPAHAPPPGDPSRSDRPRHAAGGPGPDERLAIGEFSRVTWLSPKALRLYERKGLLLPHHVDRFTGYRSYLPDQAGRARTITLLRRAGMSLERIGAVLDTDDHARRRLLEEYRSETTRAHHRAMALLDTLAADITAHPERAPDDPEPTSRDVPEQAYVATRLRTTAADLPLHIERSAAELARRAGNAADPSRPLVVVYDGEVSWESDGPVEIHVPVTTAGAADGVEPAGSEVYVEVPYAQVQFPTILRYFDAVRVAAAAGGRRPSGSPREIYDDDADPFRCRVAHRYV